MAKKSKASRLTGRPISGGNEGPRNRFATLLKWVGGVTAILSLVFALHQITKLVSDVRERQRNTAELYKVGKLQQAAADYAGAWASFEQGLKAAEPGGQLAKLTGQLGKERRQLREAQEDLAMEWLENVRVRVSPGETFSDVVDKLVPVLNRGIANSSGARKADMLAHLGWANFLRWRDGKRELNPEQQYRQALEVDPPNPYAHSFLGHWKLWTRREASLQDAREQFSAALASGRARDFVRRMQLSAMENLGQEGEEEFLRLVNEMRKNNEKIDASTSRRVYGIYSSACFPRNPDRFAKVFAAVPIAEHLAMFRALFYGGDFDKWKALQRDACLAALLEAAGQREEALRVWVTLRRGFSPADRDWRDRADAAIKRLSSQR
jgi:hypothetical protein